MTLRKRDLLPLLPLAALVVAGLCPTPWWGYADILAVLFALLMTCDPFRLLSRYLCPETRWGAAAAVVQVVAGIQMPDIDLPARACMVLVGGGLLAVFAAKNREWHTHWMFRHSAEADRVEAHLYYRGEWMAGEAWESVGCRETRSLLHQTFQVDATEEELATRLKAVWQLGYLHGMEKMQRDVDCAQLALEDAQTEIAELSENAAKALEVANNVKNNVRRLEDAERSAEYWKGYASEQSNRIQALRDQISSLEHELEELRPSESLTQAGRDAAILALVESGTSIAKAGERYGLSKGGAQAAINRARAAREAGMEE